MNDALLEMRYEDFVADPVWAMDKILRFSELGDKFRLYSHSDAHLERNQYKNVLTPDEQQIMRQRCGALAHKYGYDLDAG